MHRTDRGRSLRALAEALEQGEPVRVRAAMELRRAAEAWASITVAAAVAELDPLLCKSKAEQALEAIEGCRDDQLLAPQL